MIDTKKYEGHTLAQKWYYEVCERGEIAEIECIRAIDFELIADAPIILDALITAESRIKELEEIIHDMNNAWMCNVEWHDWEPCIKRARAALKGKE